MKTKYSEIEVNKECNVCPRCGETKSFYFDKDDNMKGVADGIYESWNSGFLWRKTMRKDRYKCYSCGHEWSSKPYEEYCQ